MNLRKTSKMMLGLIIKNCILDYMSDCIYCNLQQGIFTWQPGVRKRGNGEGRKRNGSNCYNSAGSN